MFSEDVVYRLGWRDGFSSSTQHWIVLYCQVLNGGRELKGIPNDWCCNVKAPMTEMSSSLWHNHVYMLSQTEFRLAIEMSPLECRRPRNTLDQSRADTVKSSKCYLEVELYSLRHRQPVEDITKDRSEVVKRAGTNNQTGGGVKHHLQTADGTYVDRYVVYRTVLQ